MHFFFFSQPSQSNKNWVLFTVRKQIGDCSYLEIYLFGKEGASPGWGVVLQLLDSATK